MACQYPYSAPMGHLLVPPSCSSFVACRLYIVCCQVFWVPYRSTSLTRIRTHLGPYRRPMPRVLGGSQGVGRFLMGEVPLYPEPLQECLKAQVLLVFLWARYPCIADVPEGASAVRVRQGRGRDAQDHLLRGRRNPCELSLERSFKLKVF